jgi:hypothetical protein
MSTRMARFEAQAVGSGIGGGTNGGTRTIGWLDIRAVTQKND